MAFPFKPASRLRRNSVHTRLLNPVSETPLLADLSVFDDNLLRGFDVRRKEEFAFLLDTSARTSLESYGCFLSESSGD